MAKLKSAERASMPLSEFALPGRKYPVNDRAHAANAKSRASAQVKVGKMSVSTEKKIDAKANRVLSRG